MDSIFAWLQHAEWLGILLARVVVGLLFLTSGAGKLFNREKREQMRQTVESAGIPAPKMNAVFVPAVEFLFGGLLVVGLLTPLACVMLGGVMIVALATTLVPSIEAKSPIAWLGAFLYLPEVLYLTILIWLFFAGSGWLGLDHLLF